MGTAGHILAEVGRHRAEMERLVVDLKARVMAGPENPHARRLGRGQVVNWSRLAGNWSAEHHDFRKQYEAVCKAIDAAYADRAVDVVVEAVETGSLRIKSGSSSWTMKLHAGVVEHLGKVLKGCD